jgi:glycosyltransferase involved in cell wall biosynthesis
MMEREPAVSVVIATRNRAHYLPEVLRCLAEQECQDAFEVVVIDNGSSDSTPAVLDEWCRRDPRFRAGREPCSGLSRAKNAGVRMARGNLLLFTDDDMRFDQAWIESYRAFFVEHRHTLMLAGGPISPIPNDLAAWPKWLGTHALADAGSLDYHEQRELRRFEYLWGGNMAVPRSVFNHVGLWDEKAGLAGDERVAGKDSEYFEDTELQDRLRRAGGSSWFCPAARVHHRVDRKSVTVRRITYTAFARGRNEFLQEELRECRDLDSVPRHNAARAMYSLGRKFASWCCWLALFRATKKARALDGARLAAFEAGRSLESLRSGRKSARLFRGAATVALPARDFLLRLTPNFD